MSDAQAVEPRRRSDIVGAVLAGGTSRRMGSNKTLIPVRGVPLIRRVVETLRGVLERVVILGPASDEYGCPGIETFPDMVPGCGPLGGIHAAFRHTGARRLFVAACDMPNISEEAVRLLIERAGDARAAAAMEAGIVHPLFGLYDASLLPDIERRLAARNLRMHELLIQAGAVLVPFDASDPVMAARVLANLNTPEDVRRMEP